MKSAPTPQRSPVVVTGSRSPRADSRRRRTGASTEPGRGDREQVYVRQMVAGWATASTEPGRGDREQVATDAREEAADSGASTEPGRGDREQGRGLGELLDLIGASTEPGRGDREQPYDLLVWEKTAKGPQRSPVVVTGSSAIDVINERRRGARPQRSPVVVTGSSGRHHRVRHPRPHRLNGARSW